MHLTIFGGRKRRLALALAFTAAGAAAAAAWAATPLVRISTDPFTNPTSQHKTQVEPDTFSSGSTIVAAFQSGRFFDGGSSDIGFARTTDGGVTWSHDFLPNLTQFSNPPGPYGRASDPSVAYDPKHDVWLISALGFAPGDDVVVSRSLDGGATWKKPVLVHSGGGTDKNWTVCDTWPSSPFYGNCYTEWDNNGQGNLIQMSTSTDGGATWGSAEQPADHPSGLGGVPVVAPDGRVVVPYSQNFGPIRYFTSTDGGASWSATQLVSNVSDHIVAGGLRTYPLPSAEIDKRGTVYVVWQDCRFRTSCASNDIVLAKIKRAGVSSVVRVPIDPVSSTVDHFIPGIAVDTTAGGAGAHLALGYYYYPNTSCSETTCELHVGFVSSTDGGNTWTASTELAGPMNLTWLPDTSQGRMVGDYMSTSIANGKAFPVFAVARVPKSAFREAMFTSQTGLDAGAGVAAASAEGAIPGAVSDHPAPAGPVTAK